MTSTVRASDMIGEKIKEVRKQRGMSAEDLAKRCSELGAPTITAPVIANIETGRRDKATGERRRDVTVEELLILAEALDVPPVLLFVPLDGRTRLQVTPEVDMAGWQAMFWASGDWEPGDPERRQRWRETWGPVHLHRGFATYFREAARTEIGGTDAAKRFNAAIQNLARVLNGMIMSGITPPAVPPEWRDFMVSQEWVDHPDEVRVQTPED